MGFALWRFEQKAIRRPSGLKRASTATVVSSGNGRGGALPSLGTINVRTTRRFAASLCAAAMVALAAASPAAGQTLTWPQRIAAPEGTIDVYQPQFDTLKGNAVTGRAAVGLTAAGSQAPVFGAFWFTGIVDVDRDADEVVLRHLAVTRVRWPNQTPELEQRFRTIVEAAVPGKLPRQWQKEAEALIQEEGIRVRWYVGKELGQASYLVYKAFEEDGPYQALSEFAIRGDNPYEILDVDAEPGRLHVYRVAVRDEAGLEEDLDTLRVAVPGIPQFTLRAPDPNPARDRVHLRFYLPASPAGGRVTVEAFDAMGRRVRDLGARLFSPGEEEHLVLWDLRGDDGRRVPAGMYFLRVTLEHGSRSVNGAARSLPAGPSSGVRRVVVLP